MRSIQTSGILALCTLLVPLGLLSQSHKSGEALDRQVRDFLESRSGQWRDMNVPQVDAELLYELVVEGGYTRALEIGTSTGYSGIYIAWALSKTGGKLITIDIDEGRHREAMENFKKAGLLEYVDARLADAHVLVKELEGPFDFVFSDADKAWYKNYFLDVHPKLSVGGCYVSHNISKTGWNSDYYDFILQQENYESTLNSKGGGALISYKKGE
jgi:predicted O-methyltransferase YrrM